MIVPGSLALLAFAYASVYWDCRHEHADEREFVAHMRTRTRFIALGVILVAIGSIVHRLWFND